MNIITKAIKAAKEYDNNMSTHAPKYRKSVPAPPPIGGYQPTKPMANPQPPNTGSNVRPNPNYVPPASVKETCVYETPCGWCSKWDKKCDRKIQESASDPCRECARYQWDLPECKECNAENNFKHFERW